jgi:hypothetical protein
MSKYSAKKITIALYYDNTINRLRKTVRYDCIRGSILLTPANRGGT